MLPTETAIDSQKQTRQIAIPAESALAIQTRTAQMQDKVEQQHLKRLVLSYEQREEAEELKGRLLCQRSFKPLRLIFGLCDISS